MMEMENVLNEGMIDYREIVLEIIVGGKHVSKSVYELRLSLFIQAANYYFEHGGECLEPFPSCFYDAKSRSRQYEELKMHIHNIPKMTEITEQTSLPILTWQLLNWIFTNHLDIEAITKSDTSTYRTDEIRDRYNLPSIPYSDNFCTRFQIFHPVTNRSQRFIAAKKVFGSFFAYHGSPSHNFHSIIHRGLVCALNKVGAYGYGTYLTQSLSTAELYARKMAFNNGRCSIAIVEVVKDPSVKVVDFGIGTRTGTTYITPKTDFSTETKKYFVVDKDDFMQLRQLLVFEPRPNHW